MASASNISVIIPLYNKASEIELTLRSVLIQSLPPREIIVVDDGSTDRSAEIVESIGSPLVRLIRQENSGVSAARNRAMREATGEWVALLDGDDMWGTDYLATVAEMIERWPGCGAYGTAFMIDDGNNCVPASCCDKMGVVDFFAESMTRYVLIPSATTLRRDLALELGGFPEGMRMGEDQFLWTKIARVADVCFMPKPSANSLLGIYLLLISLRYSASGCIPTSARHSSTLSASSNSNGVYVPSSPRCTCEPYFCGRPSKTATLSSIIATAPA